MKKISIIILFVVAGAALYAQDFRGLDKSPMDVAYFPDDFAHRRKGDGPFIKVYYSRPGKKDREVFGKLVPYDKVWRTGANENTEITFFKDATINGEKIKAGTYSLFTIPGEKKWTLVLNEATDYWGAYSYDQSKDALRTTIPTRSIDQPVEALTIQFKPDGENAIMQIAWDQTVAEAEIKF